MKRFVLVLVSVAMLLGCVSVFAEENCPSAAFNDVPPEGNWAHAGIDFMVEQGYMNGVGEGRFSPEGIVTRAQLVTILYRFAGSPATQFGGAFQDVADGQWYSLPIEWAAANGIVNGVGEGRFNPDGRITREQIAAILYRYSGSPAVEGDLKAFPDEETVSGYAVDALIWATQQGLINGIASGDVTNLSPGTNATRAQIAAIMSRYSELHTHEYQAAVTAPTCTEAGFTTYTCACGDSYKADEVPALGHDYKAEVTAPTCTGKGYTTYTCARCGDTYKGGETDAVGHDYIVEITAPTCTEGGYATYTCSRCGDSYRGEEQAALGHDWDEGVITVQPTEASDGERIQTCARCGQTKTTVIPSLEHVHVYTAAVVAPTCTERGYTVHTCACDDSYTDSEVPALGHDYRTVVTAPNCTEAGYTTYTCARCGARYVDDTVDALGHDYIAVVTAPTCTETGYTTYTCARCGARYVDDTVAALGHDYNALTTAPTCTETGFTTYTCSRCGDRYTGDETAALGHDFENGVCARCGETDPDFGPEGYSGYLAATPLVFDFVAVGTGGRVDRISTDGTVTRLDSGTKENLHSVYTDGPNILISGDNGTLLVSNDMGDTFAPLNTGAKGNLYGAVEFKGILYCAGSEGAIYRQNTNGWRKYQMAERNDIISLIATNWYIVAITAETDVYMSTNGTSWSHMNFNEDYHGLYPPYVYTRAVGAGETFFVIGCERDNPAIPLIMFTESGEVWMEKALGKVNGEYLTGEEEFHIHDICFNTDQIVGVMDDGRILSITNCFVCNEEMRLDEGKDLLATAVLEAGVLVCGEDFFSRVLGRRQIRQDKIGEEQAYYDVQRGALLIDVRNASELAASGYIAGSIHVPLSELAERLPEIAPDIYTELIFYCASGKRAQTATEQAVDLGYDYVYNLGGLSNLTEGYFEIVKD